MQGTGNALDHGLVAGLFLDLFVEPFFDKDLLQESGVQFFLKSSEVNLQFLGQIMDKFLGIVFQHLFDRAGERGIVFDQGEIGGNVWGQVLQSNISR